jgi:hypothetical protein
VEPEWLDVLPVEDRRAAVSRRDLRRLNGLMGHAGIMANLVMQNLPQTDVWHLTELGAGDGALTVKLLQCLPPGLRPASITLVDRVPLVNAETVNDFSVLGCQARAVRADVFEWLESAPAATVISANLFLHHFVDDELARLLRLAAARCTAFIACEPGRSALSLGASKLLGLIGCNDVTRHDAVVSVRAGFAGTELSDLWPGDSNSILEEGPAGLFSHVFAARVRRGASPAKREL